MSEKAQLMIETTQRRIKVKDYVEMIDRGELKLDPQYQRQFLNKSTVRDGLIESLLTGIEIPSVYLADHSQDDKTIYNVLDGKQRLTAIYTFIRGIDGQPKKAKIGKRKNSKLVEKGFCEDLSGKTFQDLTRQQQDIIFNRMISANIITRSSDPNMEKYIFGILNVNSTPLSKAAIIRSLYKDEFDIVDKIDEFVKDSFCPVYGIGTKDTKPDQPFLGLLATAEFICQIEESSINTNSSVSKVVDNFIDRCTEKKADMGEAKFKNWCNNLFTSLKRGLERYEQICPNGDANKKSLYSNLGVNSNNKQGVKISWSYLETVVAIFATIEIGDVSKFSLVNKNILKVRNNETFIETIADSTYSTKSFTTRYKMLMQAINDSLDGVDYTIQGPRLFSDSQKRQILAKQRLDNGQLICPICKQIIVEDGLSKIQYDHKIPYSKGGPTTVANGQAVHELCNKKKSNNVID